MDFKFYSLNIASLNVRGIRENTSERLYFFTLNGVMLRLFFVRRHILRTWMWNFGNLNGATLSISVMEVHSQQELWFCCIDLKETYLIVLQMKMEDG